MCFPLPSANLRVLKPQHHPSSFSAPKAPRSSSQASCPNNSLTSSLQCQLPFPQAQGGSSLTCATSPLRERSPNRSSGRPRPTPAFPARSLAPVMPLRSYPPDALSIPHTCLLLPRPQARQPSPLTPPRPFPKSRPHPWLWACSPLSSTECSLSLKSASD